jgi:hypothetical protein
MDENRKIAIPWQQLSIERQGERDLVVRTNADARQLASAPVFHENDWRRVSSTPYLQELYSHYQTEPFWRSPRFATSPRIGGDDMNRQGDLRDMDRQRDQERQRDLERDPMRRDQDRGGDRGGDRPRTP